MFDRQVIVMKRLSPSEKPSASVPSLNMDTGV